MMINNTLQRLFSCCGIRENQIAHLTTPDPSHFYIHLGVKALDISPNSSPLILANFGSSYGQNSIQTMQIILDYLHQSHKLQQTPLIIYNDLPTNNWSKFFQNLSNKNSSYNLIHARSFYEQCLPNNSLSMGYSSASLHYLSRKPCNILNHCYIHFGSQIERELFRNQAKSDWKIFLEHRSRELKSGGILILNIPSVNDEEEMGFNRYFHFIYQCAQIYFPEELEDFTLPFYLRSLTECMDMELFQRCSLKVIQVELIRFQARIFPQYRNKQITSDQFAKSLMMLMQAGIDGVLKEILEKNEEMTHQFWHLFEEKIRNEADDNDQVYTYVTSLILKKK